ncbi:DNA damage-inducible protein 1 [Malassezia vespertilionis]|uniref:DNA damage-inducible protein 1 n=1 Tax=Malassezia vespertilionis TaxID=2020962 RepID=A0A2N1JCA3_9BASI|nr:DNA damage-inducible protein 1 [Malassezia vespertilionis]PKI84175.1 Ddi1p [Malassezia vespertilionis]WFD06935.1 DNA damage-inducible protein 1 [Malassezia vespertilionis]
MLTVVDAEQNTFPIDTDATIEVENFKVFLEADTNIPAEQQVLQFQGTKLEDGKRTLASYGVSDQDLLMLADARKVVPGAGTQWEENGRMAEVARSQILQSVPLQDQLRSSNPALLDAALHSQERFLQAIGHQRGHLQQMRARSDLALADPFDVEAQRRIEEAIREEQVYANMEHAMEYNPEVFGNVIMLYVDLKVNGHPVKAFVDSGAQTTIMSPECAERCGIMRLVDTRFAGVAMGVGTANILGRVHSAPIQLAHDVFVSGSFTILEVCIDGFV